METLEDELDRLEDGLRHLRAEYNRYFVGAADKPPQETQFELRALVQRLAENISNQRTADRFRINTLISRYQILTQMWARNVRQLEEGQPTPLRPRGRSASSPAQAPEEREVASARCSKAGTGTEAEAIRSVYDAWVECAQQNGQDQARVPWETFYGKIRGRIEQHGERTGAEAVELRLVLVDNRPTLKLRSAR